MSVEDGHAIGARLAGHDFSAAARALNLLENRAPAARSEGDRLLSSLSPHTLGHEPHGHIIGVTGPPGAGKSSLLSRLIAVWRARGDSVAVIAVDPSSKRSGGSLLGDRARIEYDPMDKAVFIRSMAAGTRLGGLAPATRAAAAVLSACFDVVVIETVGVGQSETEVADVADTVAVVVQPGSGDVLQFLKSGIMEIPDVLVVTKADLGRIAQRAQADLHAALRSVGARERPVVATSALQPVSGIEQLAAELDAHREHAHIPARRVASRRAHALSDFATEYGERGMRAVGGWREATRWLETQNPMLDVPTLVRALEELAGERNG